jgi:hypothetical protein
MTSRKSGTGAGAISEAVMASAPDPTAQPLCSLEMERTKRRVETASRRVWM